MPSLALNCTNLNFQQVIQLQFNMITQVCHYVKHKFLNYIKALFEDVACVLFGTLQIMQFVVSALNGVLRRNVGTAEDISEGTLGNLCNFRRRGLAPYGKVKACPAAHRREVYYIIGVLS